MTEPAADTRTPPADLDAERAVLGLAMRDPRNLTAVRAHLNGGSEFWRPLHGQLWALLCREHDAGNPTDPIAVNAAVTADQTFRRALTANPSWLIDIVTAGNDTPPTSAGPHAHRIAQLHRRRTWIETLDRARSYAEDPTIDIDTVDLLAADQLEQMVQTRENRNGVTSWAAADLTAALAGHELDPPPEHLHRTDGHALLYASAVHTLAGEPGSAKSWVALHGAVQAMQSGHHAALIDFEDRASRIVARLLTLGARPEWLAGQGARFRYVRPTDPLGTDGRPDLEHATAGCALVIIDGVTEAMTMHGYDLNSNSDAATFYALLPRRITDHTGAAVVMIDHVTKDSDTRGRWAIGGQHKLAGIDGAAYQVKVVTPFGRGAHGIARITISKDRPGHVQGNALGLTAAEFHLDATVETATKAWLSRPEHMPTDDHGDPRPTVLMAKVSAYVESHPGCTGNEIRSAVKGKTEYLSRAITCLINEGHVEVTDGPKQSRLHHVLDPFDTDPEPPS